MTHIHKPGDVIQDRYEITAFLGEGGMQQVYKAHDRTLERIIALKCPKNASAERRFKKSAELSARIVHPNAAATLDYLEDTARPYLVEELIEGQDLLQLRKRLPLLDPYQAAHVMHHIARAVEASHNAGVIHRDLKPNNIMVSPGFSLSVVKITDFGIARLAEKEIEAAVEGGEDSMRTSSTMLGALAYMSPEMIDKPRDAGKPADVWAIGALCFDLLSGLKPYGEGLKVVRKIFDHDPAPFPAALRGPQFDALLDELLGLIARCMTKDVDKRITASQLREACDQLCYPETPRLTGTVARMPFASYGFIERHDGGDAVFFHRESVYGPGVGIGDAVCFAAFAGEPQHRAHPVIKLK